MKYICPECGNEIPEGSEFCHTCGRKKDDTIRLDDSGNFVPPDESSCSSCGGKIEPNDLFCQHCGAPTQRTQMLTFRPKMRKYGWIGILLAAIPGAFGLFGLGHIYFKKWLRGIMFLVISPIILYIRFGGVELSTFTEIIFILLFGFLFVMQAAEALVLAFIPPKTTE